MHKKYLLLYCFLLVSLTIWGQSNKSVISKQVYDLFTSKDYDGCIERVDNFINGYSGVKDSVYVSILKYKALSYHKLKQNDNFVKTLHEGICYYEHLNKPDKLMHWLYENYCKFAPESHPYFLSHLHSLIKCEYFYYDDYFIYLECVEKFVRHKNSYERETFLLSEEKEIGSSNHFGFEEFFLYVKGYVLKSEGTSGLISFIASNTYLERSERYLFSAFEEYREITSKNNHEILSKIYFNILDELASLSADQMKYLSAIHYRKLQLDVSKMYLKKWDRWNFKNPWHGFSFPDMISNDPLCLLKEYVSSLSEIGEYRMILSTAHSVQKSTEWNSLEDYEKEYVYSIIDKYSSLLNEYTSDVSYSFDSGSTDWILDNKYGRACSDIERLLKRKASLDEIMIIIASVNDNNIEWYIDLCELLLVNYGRADVIKALVELYFRDESSIVNYVLNGNVELSSCDNIISELRTDWHFSMGLMTGLKSWELFECWAKAYAIKGYYSQAIRAQHLAVEVLRSDRINPEWEGFYEKTIRYKLYDEDFRNPYLVRETFSPEIYGYILMSDLYRDNGNYAKQYKYLNEAFEVANKLLCYESNIGVDSHIDDAWRKNYYVYNHIMNQLPLAIDKNSKLGELALRASYMMRGFLLNRMNVIYQNLADANNKTTLNLYKSCTTYRKQIECDITKYGYISGDKNIKYENALHILSSQHSGRFVLEKSIVDLNFIKSNLRDDEIFVDFFTSYNDSMYVTEGIINNKTQYFVAFEGIVYAIIYRKTWSLPKVVMIGRNHGMDMISNDWPLERYEYTDNSERISELHCDTRFGQYCWNKIISAANIVAGESVLFVPADFYAKFAVEYLQINNSQRMSDLYKMKRLTSAYELKNRGLNFYSDDNICVIGDINYTGNVNNNNVHISSSKSIRKTSSTLDLTNRANLYPLHGGHTEITSIANLYGSRCSLQRGLQGTKTFVNAMDWSSPKCIHISTHGYNLNYTNLSSTEYRIVFGKRDTIYNDAERSMYETGIYLANSNGRNLEDGIMNAKEISMLRLHNTKLVILSACSSSTGISSSSGVYGLTRGFKAAGVKSVLGSLWDVDDEATSLLLTYFHNNLNRGYDAYSALIRAQNSLRTYVVDNGDINIGSKYIFADPYYWAGFVIVDAL